MGRKRGRRPEQDPLLEQDSIPSNPLNGTRSHQTTLTGVDLINYQRDSTRSEQIPTDWSPLEPIPSNPRNWTRPQLKSQELDPIPVKIPSNRT
ncbi:hypothetical protein chiPu_0025774 [Chiloscyllium punctatum]|uniref:Uncharacterized protein n=1 Tax=Chiloscyllium punctatum TaxID=137246 RepID=A0A401TG43_CHIPU|nr:hypothetical protein [Chiloscyllium punctatum]